jgi:polyhydroxybutyrate depolymerase
MRTYRIYLPAARAQPVPLLFVLHGGRGSGATMEQLTRGGFNRIADREGVIVIYPDGIGRNWNDGRDLNEPAARQNVDDVGFLRALIESVAHERVVDRNRVFSTGISNGGFMSFRLACEAADQFAAVAPVTADRPNCQPSRAVSVAMFNGTDDPLVPWEGGAVRVLGVKRGEAWSSTRTFEQFLAFDGCSGQTTSALVDADPADETAYRLHEGKECRDGTAVRLYEICGGGHTWARGVAYAPVWLVGRVSQEIDATVEIWQFLAAHPRAAATPERIQRHLE